MITLTISSMIIGLIAWTLGIVLLVTYILTQGNDNS